MFETVTHFLTTTSPIILALILVGVLVIVGWISALFVKAHTFWRQVLFPLLVLGSGLAFAVFLFRNQEYSKPILLYGGIAVGLFVLFKILVRISASGFNKRANGTKNNVHHKGRPESWTSQEGRRKQGDENTKYNNNKQGTEHPNNKKRDTPPYTDGYNGITF